MNFGQIVEQISLILGSLVDQIQESKNQRNLLNNLSKIRVICGPACSKCDPNFGSWICSNSDPSKLLHLVLNGRFRDALGALQERAGDAPCRPRALLGRPGVPQEGPGTDFRSMFDAPETEIASNLINLLKSLSNCRSRFCSK